MPLTLFLLCVAVAADPLASDHVDSRVAGSHKEVIREAILRDDPAVDPTVVTVGDRALAAASSAVGAATGGFVGGSLALGFSAAFSGLDARASMLPLLVLPPLCSGLGAFVGGALLVDSNVGLAAGATAAGATAVWTVVLAAVLVSDDDRLLSLPGGGPGRFDLTFAASALVPAAVAVVGASVAAAWAAPGE